MPLSRAWSPFALEMISGRLPAAGGTRFGRGRAAFPFDGVRPKSLLVPASALPAREVRKNLRRDHNSMFKASWRFARHYITSGVRGRRWNLENKIGSIFPDSPLRNAQKAGLTP